MLRFGLRLLLAVAGSILVLAGEAHAQARSPQPPSSFTWTGVYVGATGGQSRGTPTSRVEINDIVLGDGPLPPALPADYSTRADGFFAGGQLGWNYQRGRAVTGVEADLSFADIEGALALRAPLDPPFITDFGYQERLSLTRVSTVRGRVGVAPASRWLVYVTGGLAYGQVEGETDLRFYSLNGVQSARYAGTATEARLGWTIGGGTEVAMSGAWSVKMDYLHVDLGAMEVLGIREPVFAALFTVNTHDVTARLLRVGLNYRFGAR